MAKRTCRYCPTLVEGQGRSVCDECRVREHACQTCGTIFQRIRKKNPRYCSLACRPGTGKVEKIERTCPVCNNVFFRYPSQIAADRGKFCSRRCSGLGRPLNGKPSRIATEAIDLFLKRSPMLAEREKRVGRWSVDLAIPLYMVAIELDGTYWHSLPEMIAKDSRKDAWLTAHGWHVHRIVIEASDTPASVAKRIKAAVAALT